VVVCFIADSVVTACLSSVCCLEAETGRTQRFSRQEPAPHIRIRCTWTCSDQRVSVDCLLHLVNNTPQLFCALDYPISPASDLLAWPDGESHWCHARTLRVLLCTDDCAGKRLGEHTQAVVVRHGEPCRACHDGNRGCCASNVGQNDFRSLYFPSCKRPGGTRRLSQQEPLPQIPVWGSWVDSMRSDYAHPYHLPSLFRRISSMVGNCRVDISPRSDHELCGRCVCHLRKPN